MSVDKRFARDDAGIAAEVGIVALRRIDDVGAALGGEIDELGVAEGGIDILADKRCHRSGTIEIDHLEVTLLQSMRLQNLNRGQVAVGAALQGDLAALQIFDLLDAGILGNGQIERLARPAGEKIFGLETGGPSISAGRSP